MAGAVLGEGQVSLFVVGAVLGEGQVSLFVVGAVLGEGQVSLFVVGAVLGVCVVVFLWWCLNQDNTLFESSEQRFHQSRLSQTIL